MFDPRPSSPPRSARAANMRACYLRIADDSALVTASDKKHAPYLFNTLSSIHSKFPGHPRIQVFDLGMDGMQIAELNAVPWVKVRPVRHFVSHWKQNWSWKPFILTQVEERYVLYFDAANIVLYKTLVPWFNAIEKHGYFLIENGQRMRETTPPEYWALFGMSQDLYADARTFGAGIMGYDREGAAGRAINDVLERTIQGWNLGRSIDEIRNTYDHSVIRDCACFRADQTLLNLAFRSYFGEQLILREESKYCGRGGPNDHPRQFLWYARRRRESLIYFWQPLERFSLVFLLNRIPSYIIIAMKYFGGRLLRILPKKR